MMKCLDCDFEGDRGQAEAHQEATGHICVCTEEETGEFDFSGDGLPD